MTWTQILNVTTHYQIFKMTPTIRMAHLSAKIKINKALSTHKVEFVSLQLLSKLVSSLQTSCSIFHNRHADVIQ